jgi:glycosyltransferase involved in cell wall biosynthesis
VKLAITHDYLRDYRGGEKVIRALTEDWPEAPVYTAIVDQEKVKRQGWNLKDINLHISFLQKFWFPLRNKLPRYYFTLFFIPAFLSFNFQNFDVVLSSASYAGNYIRKKKALHISYIHTPPRFMYGYDTDINVKQMSIIERPLAIFFKAILKQFDQLMARDIDYFLANSNAVRERIKQAYGRDAYVIHPPVETKRFSGKSEDKGYFLVVSALGEYKKADIVVRAFNKLGLPLKIAGDGPQRETLKRLAEPNIEVLGRVSEEELESLLLECRALIFPQLEDFGITAVEAQAAGKPVIAYRAGGALETVIEGQTGLFFEEQTAESLEEAVKYFDPKKFKPSVCRAQSAKFDKEIFKQKIKYFVELATSGKISQEGAGIFELSKMT